jgi:hypothetical protein
MCKYENIYLKYDLFPAFSRNLNSNQFTKESPHDSRIGAELRRLNRTYSIIYTLFKLQLLNTVSV